MTTLTITPDVAKKKLKLAGTVASGEKVSVTVADFGTVATETLRLRVMFGDVPVGYFPLENEDVWTVSGADLTCTLNLATWQTERHCKFGAEVCFILEDTGTPQLYGTGDFSLRPWIKIPDVDVPVNLDNYKIQMIALCGEIDKVKQGLNKKYEKLALGIPKTDLAPSVQTSLDKADAVTMKVSKSAFDVLLGLLLPDNATQKDMRQIVQRILKVLQNAATCIALMLALPSFGIDGTTAWEDVPPDKTVKSVVEQFSPPADFSTNNAALVETIEDLGNRLRAASMDAFEVGDGLAMTTNWVSWIVTNAVQNGEPATYYDAETGTQVSWVGRAYWVKAADLEKPNFRFAKAFLAPEDTGGAGWSVPMLSYADGGIPRISPLLPNLSGPDGGVAHVVRGDSLRTLAVSPAVAGVVQTVISAADLATRSEIPDTSNLVELGPDGRIPVERLPAGRSDIQADIKTGVLFQRVVYDGSIYYVAVTNNPTEGGE